MTDLEQIRGILQKRGIEFTECEGCSPQCSGDSERVPNDPAGRTVIVTGGYEGFFSNLSFDAAGNLRAISAFE